MKKYLLDTHTIIWFARNLPQISNKALITINNIENNIFISDISIWEIAIKMKIGKLDIGISLKEFINKIENIKIKWLSIKHNHILETINLPFHHRDPFDRMLIAQARTENMTIITRDKNFKKYDVNIMW